MPGKRVQDKRCSPGVLPIPGHLIELSQVLGPFGEVGSRRSPASCREKVLVACCVFPVGILDFHADRIDHSHGPVFRVLLVGIDHPAVAAHHVVRVRDRPGKLAFLRAFIAVGAPHKAITRPVRNQGNHLLLGQLHQRRYPLLQPLDPIRGKVGRVNRMHDIQGKAGPCGADEQDRCKARDRKKSSCDKGNPYHQSFPLVCRPGSPVDGQFPTRTGHTSPTRSTRPAKQKHFCGGWTPHYPRPFGVIPARLGKSSVIVLRAENSVQRSGMQEGMSPAGRRGTGTPGQVLREGIAGGAGGDRGSRRADFGPEAG